MQAYYWIFLQRNCLGAMRSLRVPYQMTFIFRHLHNNAILDWMYLYDTVQKELTLLRWGFFYQTQSVCDA